MQQSRLMLILTSISGNTLEWYDFALYGYFASVIAKLFFPSDNSYISMMLTFAVFASGFIARPLGGLIFGHIGDKYGRRPALICSIALITIPTTLMGLLPSYHTIGVYAPILLVVLRLLQGLAVSGELTGSGAFLVESAPTHKKAYYGSLIMCSTYLGLLIGSGLGAITTIIFSTYQVNQFAWRLPFILALLFGVAALVLRLKCQESPLFQQESKRNNLLNLPLKIILKQYAWHSVLICCLSSALAVAIYLIIGYLPSYYVSKLSMSLKASMIISFIGLITLTIAVPIMGIIADKTHKKLIFAIGTLGFILFAYLIFNLVRVEALWSAILSEMLIALFLSPIAATLIALLSETFPTNIRYTGISIGYNFSMTIFGGTTPLIATYLTNLTDSNVAPAYYLIGCAILSLVALLLIKPPDPTAYGNL